MISEVARLRTEYEKATPSLITISERGEYPERKWR